MYFLLGFCLVSIAIFLIILILLQRGKGGGLVGALGGAGGQSAFGTRAGDTFTQFTVYGALIWCLLSVIAVRTLNYHASQRSVGLPAPPPASPVLVPPGVRPVDPVGPSVGTPAKKPDDKKTPAVDPKPDDKKPMTPVGETPKTPDPAPTPPATPEKNPTPPAVEKPADPPAPAPADPKPAPAPAPADPKPAPAPAPAPAEPK